MRSQIIQLSILILLSLTSHLASAHDCAHIDKDLKAIAAKIADAENALKSLKDKQVQLGANYTQNCILCGTFYPYDTVSGISAPASLGFQGGMSWKDNSPEYVGHGNASTCGNHAPCPGVISTNPAAPGAYMSCGTGEIYDRTSAYYLVNHPDLTWVPTNLIGMFSVSNTIRISGGKWPFMFGRVLINGRYSIGKVNAGNHAYGLYVQSSSGSVYFKSGFEVLTCNIPCPCCTVSTDTTATPITSTSTTTTITTTIPSTTSTMSTTTTTPTPMTPTKTMPSTTTSTTMPTTEASCGTLKYYNVTSSLNDPALYGFASGTFFDNSIIYPGTGNFGGSCFNQNPGAARIMTSNGRKGPGGYYTCVGGEQFENKEAKFYLNHPNMKWVKTTGPVAPSVPGAIKVINPHGTFFVGRINVTIGNGTFQDIGKLEGPKFYYTGVNVTSYSVSQTDFEILVCQ